MKQLQAAKIAKVVHFKCGCIAEYPLVGQFSDIKEWHIISTCTDHHGLIKTVELVADEQFNNAVETAVPQREMALSV